MTNPGLSFILIITEDKGSPKNRKGNKMEKLINKLLNSEAVILNPSEKTMQVMAGIGLALVATGLIAVVVALFQM